MADDAAAAMSSAQALRRSANVTARKLDSLLEVVLHYLGNVYAGRTRGLRVFGR
jgi:hypothetical protein